jgi:hypothetical protein
MNTKIAIGGSDMPKLNRESFIALGNKEMKVEEVLKAIIYLPASQIKAFFHNLGLNVPRELRISALRTILRDKVNETRKTRLTLADELNYRLSWFSEFTETQLENLLIFFDDPKLDREYLQLLWIELLSYIEEKMVNPQDVKMLYDESVKYVKVVGLDLPNMKTFNYELREIFFDGPNRIDGLPPKKFRPVLYKSSTLTEIRDLGMKYDVHVPKRLKKNELADIIVKELKDRGEYTQALDDNIRGMSVLLMQRFAIDHDIKASTELKKEEIIEYILSNAKETRETYFSPVSEEVYEKEIDQVQQDLEDHHPRVVIEKEPKIEEPMIEKPIIVEKPVIVEVPKKEEIKEVPVVEEPIEEIKTYVEEVKPQVKEQIKYVESRVDLSEIAMEIRLLRDAIEKIQVKRDVKEEQFEPSAHVERQLDTEGEPIYLNSAEFYGKKKHLKDIIKSDEVDEREAFIESKKATSSIGTGKEEEKEKAPAELRFFGKVFKGLFKFLWKILKVLLKIALIVFIIAAVVLIAYSLIDFFLPQTILPGIRDSITNGINGIQILGKGLVEHIFDILRGFGLTEAA